MRLPDIPCLFKQLTGIPCPGCGTIRSLNLLLQGKVKESLMMNPLGVMLTVLAVVCLVWLLVDLRRGSRSLHKAFHTRWPSYTIVLAAVFTLANWVWNIYKEL